MQDAKNQSNAQPKAKPAQPAKPDQAAHKKKLLEMIVRNEASRRAKKS